jgi:hypothetical protein
MGFKAGCLARAGVSTTGALAFGAVALTGALGAGAGDLAGEGFTGAVADAFFAAGLAETFEGLTGERATGISSQRVIPPQNTLEAGYSLTAVSAKGGIAERGGL